LVERRQRVAEEAAAPARLSWTIVQCGHAAVAPVRRSASGGLRFELPFGAELLSGLADLLVDFGSGEPDRF